MIHIRHKRDMAAYIRTSMPYSALKTELQQTMFGRAVRNWYLPLVDDGYTAFPFCLVLDLGVRTLHPGQTYAFLNSAAPDSRLFSGYVHALDACYRDTVLRELMSDITLHRQDAGLILMIKKLLGPILLDAPVMAVVEREAQTGPIDLEFPAASDSEYLEALEQMIRHFTDYVLKRTEGEIGTAGLLSSLNRRLIQAVTRQESSITYPDLELIDRCMHMDDLPAMKSLEHSAVMRSLHTMRLEQPISRQVKPDGGFVGIRNNGGLEDLSNPVISEWAHPAPLLWDKLTNRNLLIYERAARTLYVNHMAIHMMLLESGDLMELNPDSGRIPLEDMKFLMAAITRDLALYASQIRSVEVQLNLQLASSAHSPFDVRRVTLSGMTEGTVLNPEHFLLFEREVFPWFFSTSLNDETLWEQQIDTPSSPGEDLIEDFLPERDIQLAGHIEGFENAHCFVLCSADQYTARRAAIIDHVGHTLDLNPSGLDSLIFVISEDGAEKELWRVDPVHILHRSAEFAGNGQAFSPPISSLEVREMVRSLFLGRLLGTRYRTAGVQHVPVD